jgi:carbon-monoxide dehydrogenase large subunit
VLEAAVADIEFSRGRFEIAGTDRFIEIMELATMLRRGLQLPPELPQSLDVQHVHESSPSAFPNGCHIAEVEIGPETGIVEVVKYSMVNDFGVIVNPLLVAGQAHGGVVQGIGQALMERTVFDEEGQFLTGSFTDYALPRASDAVMFQVDSHPVPAKTNSLGAKGCGEAGCAGSLPAVDECCRRRTVGIWHSSHRHAGDTAQDLAGHPAHAIISLDLEEPMCGPLPALILSYL